MSYSKLALVAAVLSTSVLLPAPAVRAGEYDNATQCRGRLLEYVPFKIKNGRFDPTGQQIGQLQFYYSEGENLYCAIMLHGGPTWDKPLLTGVRFYKYAKGSQSVTDDSVGERAVYRFQAGPIGARAHCMQAGGRIDFRGQTWVLYSHKRCL